MAEHLGAILGSFLEDGDKFIKVYVNTSGGSFLMPF